MNKTHNINEKTQLPHQIQTQQGKEKNLKQVSFIRKWSGSQMTGTMYSMHLTEVQTSLTTSNNVTLAERKVPFIQSNWKYWKSQTLAMKSNTFGVVFSKSYINNKVC